jgi:signal transduction histidine kinase
VPHSRDDTLRQQQEANEHLLLATLRLEEQADLARAALTESPAAVGLVRGLDLTIAFANPEILNMWGRTNDVVGLPILDALPELRGQGFDLLMMDVMRTGTPYLGNEVPARLVRGGRAETVYFNFAYTPTRDARNVIDGVAIIAFDVTAQAVARKLMVLTSAVGHSLVGQDSLQAQLVQCCEALVQFGVASARIWTYEPGEQRLECRASAGLGASLDETSGRVALGAGPVGSIALRRAAFVTNDVGAERDVVSAAWAPPARMAAFGGYPLVVGDRLVGVLAIFAAQELSADDQRTLESVADQIALGIERDSGERLRALFVGMLGHDLRSPLTAITMGADLLASAEPVRAAHRRTVDRIRSSAARMERMIEQILDLTRAGPGGGIPIARGPADLMPICLQAVDELTNGAAEPDVEVTADGDTCGDWDAERLAQVLTNLVGNAFKHGLREPRVRVEVDGTGPLVRCAVWNAGPAIPAALMPRLFDPFRQGLVRTDANADGLGLGLFIAQQIVIAHGGRIEVRSTDAEGTAFSFALPRSSAARRPPP